jgi:hypothetical protein
MEEHDIQVNPSAVSRRRAIADALANPSATEIIVKILNDKQTPNHTTCTGYQLIYECHRKGNANKRLNLK